MAKVTMESGKGKATAGLSWLDLTLESAHSAHAQGISPMDRGLAYGDGLFATMALTPKGEVAFLDTHLSRLQQGACRLGFVLDIKDIESRLVLAAKAQAKHQNPRGLKLLISRGPGGRGYQAPDEASPQAVLSAFDVPAHYRDWQRKGICLFSSELNLAKQPKLAGMKHLNRLEQVLIRAQHMPEWAQDFLVSDTDGALIEASMANLFFISGDTAYTPYHAFAGVSGVMREQIIQALLERGYRVVADKLCPDMLAKAQAVIMCNSLLGLVDVVRIDTFHYQVFAESQSIRDALELNL
ncbi:aminodeoxychorismate lyase [Shewanella zhangzhouensis]|uniref:aminodeoxychorismate lyase n=1 Tax=Shewanella zhangzhouensis TaxID=2864213 RepID=UPI0021AC7D01|nr:aminodeoxychorismate lyase [Shewanella zhangzhouensis]